uniref:WRKY domain-containing protein n=1 Tax=Aegilops tauschii subsp. strangulata TaxID=200361 RepID=A0A453H0T1_AEGTS
MASTSQPPTTGNEGGERGHHGDEEEQQQGAWAEAAGGQPLVMPEDGYQWKKYGQKFIKNIQKIRYVDGSKRCMSICRPANTLWKILVLITKGARRCGALCRSYFRCRDKRCGAKKKVEWQPGDPNLRVVYDGAHQHGSPSSNGGGQDADGAANRYDLSTQYFGGAGAPTPQTQ